MPVFELLISVSDIKVCSFREKAASREYRRLDGPPRHLENRARTGEPEEAKRNRGEINEKRRRPGNSSRREKQRSGRAEKQVRGGGKETQNAGSVFKRRKTITREKDKRRRNRAQEQNFGSPFFLFLFSKFCVLGAGEGKRLANRRNLHLQRAIKRDGGEQCGPSKVAQGSNLENSI